ncbi:uncharacterized protein LOC130747017 [Lotus japonicus]|uniref:uncharacterized protein LOC130747017 n=1 Tax=Lotus japonicus TaxID=34305 RepID=UPI0025896AE6|nr:uncharacterized protein LOC130747017 [Lotus japonicus]
MSSAPPPSASPVWSRHSSCLGACEFAVFDNHAYGDSIPDFVTEWLRLNPASSVIKSSISPFISSFKAAKCNHVIAIMVLQSSTSNPNFSVITLSSKPDAKVIGLSFNLT